MHFKTHFNLTLHQLHLLRDLADDPSITIKPADKGGGIIILDSTTYREEALRQLNDTSSYVKISSDPTRFILNIVRIMVHKAFSLDYFTKDLADFLIVEHPTVPLFYLLPKIHKPSFPPGAGRSFLLQIPSSKTFQSSLIICYNHMLKSLALTYKTLVIAFLKSNI